MTETEPCQCQPSPVVCSAGCGYFFDGLVCWPSTPPGEEAGVNCWAIEAFAQALGKNNKSGVHGKIEG